MKATPHPYGAPIEISRHRGGWWRKVVVSIEPHLFGGEPKIRVVVHDRGGWDSAYFLSRDEVCLAVDAVRAWKEIGVRWGTISAASGDLRLIGWAIPAFIAAMDATQAKLVGVFIEGPYR